MKLSQVLITSLLGITSHFTKAENQYYAAADDGAAAADDQANAADDGGDDGGNNKKYGYYYGDDGGVGKYYTSSGASYEDFKGDYTGDGTITYWTEYAVQPKKCITYGNRDMIVFSMYEKYYNHCKDSPIGTYMVDVPTFVTAWVDQKDLNSYDFGGDDYVSPDTTYVSCYPYETNNGVVSALVLILGLRRDKISSSLFLVSVSHLTFDLDSHRHRHRTSIYNHPILHIHTVLRTTRMCRWRQSIPLRQRLQRQHMRNTRQERTRNG
jgi:hypothetical protein